MDERGLGERLQAARKAAGLTQQELCHRANLSFSTLTKIERGAIKAPSIFTIQSIATTLGLSLDELVGSGGVTERQLGKTKGGASFIYFDVNGCLVRFYQAASLRIAEATGARPEIVETTILRYNNEVCRGTMSLSDFNAKLAERLEQNEFDWQSYYLAAIEPVTAMHELAKYAAAHYKVGLLTNIMPGLLSVLKRQGLLPDITYDTIIDSSAIGAVKPEAKIYEVAEERAGCPPDEILFIDDTQANVMAAAERGWQVMLYDESKQDESLERVREALEPAS